jgi:hypothetical protein
MLRQAAPLPNSARSWCCTLLGWVIKRRTWINWYFPLPRDLVNKMETRINIKVWNFLCRWNFCTTYTYAGSELMITMMKFYSASVHFLTNLTFPAFKL